MVVNCSQVGSMRSTLQIILLIISVSALGQEPVINNVQPLKSGPNQKVVITGNGFSSTSSQLNVWFDQVRGTITNSTAFSVEVQVPPQARFSNVEIINLSNNLSGKSPLKFLPSYGGQQFDVSKTANAYSNTDGNELFDIATSDLDLDGKPDMVTSRGGPTSTANISDIYIYQNTSTGIGNINFTRYDKTTIAALNIGAPTANVACGDLNGDGKPDIVASRGGNTRNQVYIIKNTNSVAGTMSFAAQTSLFLDASQSAFRISIRDLNQDGKPEIIVSNAFDDLNAATDNEIYVYPNQSTGSTISFGAAIKLSVTGASSTYGLDVQDLDGDGLADIVVNQFQSNNVYVFRNTSTGNITFDIVKTITATGSFNNIMSSDLNNDGKLDLLATATLDNNVQIWINQSTPGSISFGGSQTLASSKGPWGIDVSDIDGDGDADIIVANKNGVGTQFDNTDIKLNIFRQDSPLSFTRLDIVTTNPTRNLRVGDLDGDGKPDIAYSSFPVAGLTFTANVIRNANCWSPVITSSTGSPSPAPICTSQTIRIQTQPALGATYVWKNGSTTVQSGTLEYFDVVGSANAGTYTVTVNGTVDAGCSVQSTGFTLTSSTGTAPANPSIGNNVPCLGSVLNLTTPSVASATYSWTGPNGFISTSQNPTINPVVSASAGVYSLQVTVGPCQSNVTTKQLDVASVPTLPVTSSPAALACAGSSITLSVSGTGYTFQWKKGGVAIGGQTASSLALTSLSAASEGDYSVVVTSISTTCFQETAKTSVKVFSPASAAFSMSTPDCAKAPITFTDQSTGLDSRGTAVYTWSFGDASPTSTLQSPSHSYVLAGNFSPNLTVSYQGVTGCASNVTKPLTVNAPTQPTIQASADPICSGDQTTLSISGSYTSIAWVGATGNTSSVLITEPGKYKVSTTDANGCTALDSLTVGSKPLISPFTISTYQNKTSINAGDTLKLTATSGADTYTWSHAETLSDATIFNPIAKPTLTTTYKVVATKAGSCDAIDSIKVTVETGVAIIKPPKIFSPNNDGCNDTWKLCQSTTPCVPGACPEETTYNDWTMTIYDGHGGQVIQQKGFTSWDGSYNGQKAPDGTYFYVFSNGSGRPATGSILLVR
ncbi:MAG TPA: hypothetical protein DGG95_12195 [Cytophagales bacterium]|nr:hypothetical protein [Cytophagales bacterium]